MLYNYHEAVKDDYGLSVWHFSFNLLPLTSGL